MQLCKPDPVPDPVLPSFKPDPVLEAAWGSTDLFDQADNSAVETPLARQIRKDQSSTTPIDPLSLIQHGFEVLRLQNLLGTHPIDQLFNFTIDLFQFIGCARCGHQRKTIRQRSEIWHRRYNFKIFDQNHSIEAYSFILR